MFVITENSLNSVINVKALVGFNRVRDYEIFGNL